MVKYLILTTIVIFVTTAKAGLPPTSTKGANDPSYKTTFKFDFPYFNLVHTGTTAQLGILAVSGGGTGLSNYSTGSFLVATAPQTISQVPIAVSNSILLSDGTQPVWGSGTDLYANRSLSNLTTTAINAELIMQNNKISGLAYPSNASDAANKFYVDSVIIASSANKYLSNLLSPTAVNQNLNMQNNKITELGLPTSASDAATKEYVDTQVSGAGTVKEVALTLPSIFTVTGSPVKVSGTLSATLNTQAANTIFAGPGAGAAATPTFRTLVDNDIPQISLASGVFGTLSAISGGTGQTTYSVGDLLYANTTTNFAKLAIGSANQILWVSSSGIPYWANAVSGVNQAISTVSSTYSVLAGDATILANASTSSFTITIPPAASYPTKVLIVRKIDTNLPPKIVSMAGGFTKHLYTPNESYTIQSDGNAWNVLQHETHYAFQPTIISVGAATTAPNAGTYTENRYTCERNGKSLNCNISYYGTGAGGTAGSGDYYLRPPTYLSGAATIDTSITGTYTGGTLLIAASTATIGYCFQSNGSTNTYAQPLSVFNSDSFRLANVVNNSFWRSNSNAFNTTIYMSCSLKYPITEWSD